jgi:cytoskeletal protein CcmA (bactofilin family)
MFKNTEESEWSRFAKALQPQGTNRAEPAPREEDETVELAAAEGAPADPRVARDEPSTPPAYAQAEPAHTRAEPAFAQPEPPAYAPPAYRPEPRAYRPDAPAYAQSEPAAYPQPEPTGYAVPAYTEPEYAEPEPARAAEPATPPPSAAASADPRETVIGEGASFEGVLRADNAVRVRGFVSGEIHSGDRVVVEDAARVQARIVAGQVTVVGEVSGQVECSGRVEIAPTGRVTGEVTTGTLIIQEGAFFQGQLTMVPKETATADEEATAGEDGASLDGEPVG